LKTYQLGSSFWDGAAIEGISIVTVVVFVSVEVLIGVALSRLQPSSNNNGIRLSILMAMFQLQPAQRANPAADPVITQAKRSKSKEHRVSVRVIVFGGRIGGGWRRDAGGAGGEQAAETKKESRGCDLQLLYAATSTALDSLL
jgi:hypothetical protein